MNTRLIAISLLCLFLCGNAYCAEDIDAELVNLAERLAGKIKAKAIKKVAVIDFTDLQEASSELGKYIAEQLTVDLVMTNQGFAVLDRANLNRILSEHKLTAKGLIDPDNCKKLGMFAGVDAIIIGKIIPKGAKINLTTKVIATETSEIEGAEKATFAIDENVKDMMAHAAAPAKSGMPADEKSGVSKSIGNLRVNLENMRIINNQKLMLTMTLSNQSSNKSIWVSIGSDMNWKIRGQIVDANGQEYTPEYTSVTGVSAGVFSRYGYQPNTFSPATEIKPEDSLTATIKFSPQEQTAIPSGQAKLQLEILVGKKYINDCAGDATVNNISTSVDIEQLNDK